MSIPFNLSEGRKRAGKDRLHLFRIAAGSADEIRAALDHAEDREYVPTAGLVDARAILDRQCALLWGLTHPRR